MPDILLAFDRQTARSRDADGRLRVKNCVLSVAEVNPYYGREIPGADGLGLRPETVYDLYRDPDELKRAVPSFEGLPLMIKHVAQTADNPRKEYVGGSVHNVSFAGKNLRGDLLVWDGEAIDLIESDELSDLSCSYRYKPVMQSGTTDDKKYDGVMTAIEGNHVALVDDGRASGAHVADAALRMPQPSDSSTQGAASMAIDNPAAPAPAAATPQPAAPAPANGQADMAMIGSALKQIGVILQDIQAKLPAAEAPAPAPAPAAPVAAGAEDADMDDEEKTPPVAGAADIDLETPVQERGTLQNANDEELVGPATGVVVDVPNPDEDGTGARGNDPVESVIGAMDAKSVKQAINNAVANERRRIANLNEAKDATRHVLGDVAMDSAADVYRAALNQQGVSDRDIPHGGEKAAWLGYRNAAAVARGAVPHEAVNHAHDSALKNTNSAHLSALARRISVKG